MASATTKMQLSGRSTRSVAVVNRRPVRTTRMVVRAQNLADQVAQAFVRIFSPSDAKTDFKHTGHSYMGKISRERKPFKDGFTAKVDPSLLRDDAAAEGYLDGAVKSVISNNFKGDVTEPDWTGSGSSGWKGDIHGRGTQRKEGFHTQTY